MTRRQAMKRAVGVGIGAMGGFLFGTQAIAKPQGRRLTMWVEINSNRMRRYFRQQIQSGQLAAHTNPEEFARHIQEAIARADWRISSSCPAPQVRPDGNMLEREFFEEQQPVRLIGEGWPWGHGAREKFAEDKARIRAGQ